MSIRFRHGSETEARPANRAGSQQPDLIPPEPDGHGSANSRGTSEDHTPGVICRHKCTVLKFLEGGS